MHFPLTDDRKQVLIEGERREGRASSQLLARLAALLRERVAALSGRETRNMGIPIRESRFEVLSAARHLGYFAGFVGKIEGTAAPLPDNRLMYTIREPDGVVGQSVPWTSPLKLMARGCAAALALLGDEDLQERYLGASSSDGGVRPAPYASPAFSSRDVGPIAGHSVAQAKGSCTR